MSRIDPGPRYTYYWLQCTFKFVSSSSVKMLAMRNQVSHTRVRLCIKGPGRNLFWGHLICTSEIHQIICVSASPFTFFSLLFLSYLASSSGIDMEKGLCCVSLCTDASHFYVKKECSSLIFAALPSLPSLRGIQKAGNAATARQTAFGNAFQSSGFGAANPGQEHTSATMHMPLAAR